MTTDQRALLSAAAQTTDWICITEVEGATLADARLLTALEYGNIGVCPRTGARTFRISMAGLGVLEDQSLLM